MPQEQKNNELYPIGLMKKNILADILNSHTCLARAYGAKNIETAMYENGIVIANHSSHPYKLNHPKGIKYLQYETSGDYLMPHSAVFIEKEEV